jgi:hypothetical protein
MEQNNALKYTAQLIAARDADWAALVNEYGFNETPEWEIIEPAHILREHGIGIDDGCACWKLVNRERFLIHSECRSVPVLNLVLYGPDGKGGSTCWMS